MKLCNVFEYFFRYIHSISSKKDRVRLHLGAVHSPSSTEAMMTAFERGSASKAGAKRVAEAPPYMERPSKTAMAMKKEKTNLASQGHASTREADEKALRYVKILQRGANGVSGILATHDEQGAELIPYSHQRQAVKFCAAATGEAKLIAHDAGCGKTATFFQLMAAIELLVGGGACAIVTVPPACISQWEVCTVTRTQQICTSLYVSCFVTAGHSIPVAELAQQGAHHRGHQPGRAHHAATAG